ncbi:MAG: hypothetical protein ACI9OI_002437, partial [Chitinophagales bacterium]
CLPRITMLCELAGFFPGITKTLPAWITQTSPVCAAVIDGAKNDETKVIAKTKAETNVGLIIEVSSTVVYLTKLYISPN